MNDVRSRTQSRRDSGLVLPLTLVVVFILGVVVVAIVNYGTSNLRYGRVAEEKSDQLAASDAAMRYAVDLLRVGAAPCIYTTQAVQLPALASQFNGATGSVRCDTIAGGLGNIRDYAMAITGENVPTGFLISTQGGSIAKELTGPVFVDRVVGAFDLSTNAGINVKRGLLLYTDATPSCVSISKWYAGAPAGSTLPKDVTFEPDFQFGPQCVPTKWYDHFNAFDEPPIASDILSLPIRDGGVVGTIAGTPSGVTSAWAGGPINALPGYNRDTSDCYVFEPGRYIRPPVVPSNRSAYFKSGTYWFDFRTPTVAAPVGMTLANWPWAAASESRMGFNKAFVTAGRRTTMTSELPLGDCASAYGADMPASSTAGGATFYMSGKAHIEILNQGALEIFPALRGTDDVAIHALCSQTPIAGQYPATNSEGSWCHQSAATFGASPFPSTLVAPASNSTGTTNPSLVYTDPGNNREMVSHGLIWAPLAQMEFGNVTNSAIQKMKGGLVLARAVLQSSTSAENFEIGVSASSVDSTIRLTSTGAKDGYTTEIRAIAEIAANASYADAVALNSWRVCEGANC
jgi:hypothetical protein